MYTSPTLTNVNIKSIIFNTKSFLKKTTDNPSMVKVLKINKFKMLGLSEAMDNEVTQIKIVCFGIHTFKKFYVALWDL